MLTIIVPVHNQHELTHECLDAVREHTRNYDLVVVDNGSSPVFVPRVHAMVIRNERNVGFPAAVNQGIRAAKGGAICLLNNDVIVTPGWADRCVSQLGEYAIVGPMTNYCAGLQRTTVPAYYDRKGLDEVATAWGATRTGRLLSVNWVIGFCFFFRASLAAEIGGFDESLWPCSGEEIDFCYRARATGHQVGVVQDCYVHHEGSQTLTAMQEAGQVDYARLVERNDAHLASKWGKDFWAKQLLPFAEETGIRLNLGCGRFKLPGFVNIDMSPRWDPDMIADALALPYDAGTVDEIYAGHLIEHFTFSDGMKALAHWADLLRDGGLLSVSTPDYDAIVREYLLAPTAEQMQAVNDLYIYSEDNESPHKYLYNASLLKRSMREAGFVDLVAMPVDHPYFPVAVDWQVGIQGRKRGRDAD